ncbi:MAG TPA: sterol desaturase family protein [Acidimicrobiales bacterium]|nr:sterol desaturase family protein [Acidimicrobiales bacterium]
MRSRRTRPSSSAPRRSAPDGDAAPDLTVLAVPFYFASMAGEYLWLRRRAAQRGPTAGDYEKRDTLASLAMGVGSLVAPLVMPKLLKPFTPGRGRYGKALVVGALGAVAATTVADLVTRRVEARGADAPEPDLGESAGPDHGDPGPAGNGSTPEAPRASRAQRRGAPRLARQVSSVGGVVAVVAGGVAITTTWASRTTPERLWRRRVLPDIGTGPLALAAAIAAWDFLYYWDHRFMHTSRYMWAIHVVHHSSEHYNLSTALRQPVAEAFGTFVPFGSLCLLGIRPGLVESARGVNLLYQYWIHTETLGALGPAETVLNTPSHHRVHHGSNRQYLDRNHGSILILWDRLFGTFEPEDERVVYGLTKNIDTFNPGRIATHEYVQMLRDVAASTSWRERLSYVVRGPGWATDHRAERAAASGASVAAAWPPDLEVPVSA